MSILVVDQSTSASKAILFDENGAVLDHESREHRQIYPREGWVEHDANEIFANVITVLAAVATRNELPVALSITNQRETVLVFDRETGKPLHNAIVWQCRRGESICAELRDAGHEQSVQQRTGLKLDTYFSASKLLWLRREHPDIARKMDAGEALVGTIDAYLIYRLTQGAVHATDHTNASRTLLFDIGELQWDEELAALFEVPLHALPEVRESNACFGETALGGNLSDPIPILGVMGDSQAALFAQRCFRRGDAKVTLGTGSSVLMNTGSVFDLPRHGSVAALAWVIQGEPTYALEGIINYSAATVSWLKNQLRLIESAEETESLANAVEDNGGVYLVPAFTGLSAPHWQPNAKAAIVGMTASTTKEHVVRAALESIAYQIRDALQMMRADGGVRVRSLRVDGGATANGFLMQFLADILQVDVEVADVPDLSALGAAFAGLIGRGIYSNVSQLAEIARGVTPFRPEMNVELVAKNCKGWQQAVPLTFPNPQS